MPKQSPAKSFLSALTDPAFAVNPPATPSVVEVVVAGGELVGAVVLRPLSVEQHASLRAVFPPEFYGPHTDIARKWRVSAVYCLPSVVSRWARRASPPRTDLHLQWS